jgi:hypothetical protein
MCKSNYCNLIITLAQGKKYIQWSHLWSSFSAATLKQVLEEDDSVVINVAKKCVAHISTSSD